MSAAQAFSGIDPRRGCMRGGGSRRWTMIKKLMFVVALSGGLVLSACNTVRGAAADVESAGDCVDGVDNNC